MYRPSANHHHSPLPYWSFLAVALLILVASTTAVSNPHPIDHFNEAATSYIVQAKEMETVATAVSQINAPITHELSIINAIAADLTPRQYQWLKQQPNLILHENSRVISAGTTTHTIADNFSNTAYNNNDGDTNWSSDWIESGESTHPAYGDIYISGGYLRLKDDNRAIERQLDTSNATSITLSFDYGRIGLDSSSDYIAVEVSTSGSSGPWHELTRFSGPAYDSNWQPMTLDMTPYSAANTILRFATSPTLGNYDKLYIDNLQISYTEADNSGGSNSGGSIGNSPNPSGTEYANLNVRDEFSTANYSNNDGAATWQDPWSESDSGSGGATGGQVKIANGQLQLAGTNNSLVRYFDLKDAISATLSFTYQRNFASSSDSLFVMFESDRVSTTGLAYFIDGAGSDNTPQQVTIDLAPHIENPGQAYIRFETSSSFHSNSSITIDNVDFSYTTYAPDVDFPTLVQAYDAHSQGVTGAGTTIAVVDTGMGYEGHVFFDSDDWQYTIEGNRVPVSYDAVHNQTTTNTWDLLHSVDSSGHGTHVTSIIASSQSNNENGRKNGIAPQANIIPIRAFDSSGSSTYADVIRGVDWIVTNKDTYGIRVINASFFSEPQSYYWEDPLNQALMQAWQAGIVVVASAGNIPATDNHAMTIGAPGNIPYIITVGGMTDAYTPDDPSDDKLLSFSAMGPTAAKFVKPDIVAPGGHIRSYMPENSSLVTQHTHLFDQGDYFTMSGTSQAAAVVSGIVALMLDADPSLTPDTVKCRLMSTAYLALETNGDLAAPIYAQGAGLANAYDAVNSTASGCANQGLDIAADLAGTQHFAGPVEWDDQSQQFVIYDEAGTLLDHVSWSGGGAFMSGGGAFMSGGGAFMSGGGAFMSGGGAFMSGGGAFMSGGGAFMSGTTPWNASVVWDTSENFVGAASAINTWIDQQE